MARRVRGLFVFACFAVVFGVLSFGASGVSAQQRVYSDDMSSPALGLFAQASPDPSQYSYQYRNGQFIAQAVNTYFQGEIFSFANTPDLVNSTTAVDVGIGGADEREIYGFVGCRAGVNDEGYLFLLEPTTGRAALWRQDATGPVLMAETFVKQLVTPGVSQFNRLAIDCYDNQISGAVNGTVVLSEFDSTYGYGLSYVGIGNTGGAPDNLFGVFDNLVITDFGGGTAVVPAGFTKLPALQMAGPLSGILTEQATTITTANAGVSLVDFFATASFVAPSNMVPWDITIAFRDSSVTDEYRLTIASTGQWQLNLGTSTQIATGVVGNLLTAPGSVNTIDLLVEGANGAAALNGVDFAVLNLSASVVAGDVWIATANTGSTTQVGRVTQYSAFEVWATA
ncbi:MAG: hypothetical protein IT335_01050 [Thermomicrobiales bacterium]|nr:hypothetical protein [Thermomicrobiales bacterium]